MLVVGDGPERRNLESLGRSLACKVDFLGDIPAEMLPTIYQKAPIFILNSEYEGLPHALVEARMSGCISIARRGTGSEEVIHDGVDGFLVSSQSEMKTVLARLTNLDANFSSFKSLAREDSIKRFNQTKNFPSILSVLEAK
jgi:glycosyltransferase involved in cell wall biosynthesis